jgi:hypothetical protein
MSLVWRCDRCKAISDMGNVDDPPEDWERRVLPVRGSQGARSDAGYTLCRECDDDLYRWFHEPPTTARGES